MRKLGVALLVLAGVISTATAADYPTRPLTIIVPFGPGGSNDIVGRYAAENLNQLWGQSVVTENRPGAGAVIGSNQVARAAPDGYTLLATSVTFTTTPAVQEEIPYDPHADLIPAAMIGAVPLVLATGPSVEASTLDEFLEIARDRQLFYADVGPGSINQFAAELFNDGAGVEMLPVHYQDGASAMASLMGGHVDLYFGTITQLLPMIESGQLNAIMVTSAERNDSLPDTVSGVEAGLEDVLVEVWWGLFAPAGTPEEVISKINEGIISIFSSEEGVSFLARQGAVPSPISSEDFAARVHSDLDRWKEIAARIGMSE